MPQTKEKLPSPPCMYPLTGILFLYKGAGCRTFVQHPIYETLYQKELFSEVSAEKSGKGFAVAGFVTRHLVDGIVNCV